MQYEQRKVELSPIAESKLEELTLETAYGRDAIAELIEARIDEYCYKQFGDAHRDHLGASEIGHECLFYLWSKFRWMWGADFNGRMQRLFQRGHIMEPHYIAWLESCDVHISQTDENGKQHRFEAVGGHFGGSCDGKGIFGESWGKLSGKRFLLELKTNKDSDFDKLKSIGVIKHIPKHYKQMCTYGKHLQLEYALYININKNNDELSVECLQLDWTQGDDDLQKAQFVILSNYAPQRISNNPSDYRCRWCDAQQVCQLGAMPDRNCRSCAFASPIENKQWYCGHYQQVIPSEFIPQGCGAWTNILKPH